MTNMFEVDGGRYGGKGGRLGTCDICNHVDVPCISVPAAEDQSETGVCEACVKLMLQAFENDRAKRIQITVPDVEAIEAMGASFIPKITRSAEEVQALLAVLNKRRGDPFGVADDPELQMVAVNAALSDVAMGFREWRKADLVQVEEPFIDIPILASWIERLLTPGDNDKQPNARAIEVARELFEIRSKLVRWEQSASQTNDEAEAK
jgi:hypothetical protein